MRKFSIITFDDRKEQTYCDNFCANEGESRLRDDLVKCKYEYAQHQEEVRRGENSPPTIQGICQCFREYRGIVQKVQASPED